MARLPLVHSYRPTDVLQAEPLTPPAFAPFGTAISSPLSPAIQTLPTASPPLVSNHPTIQPAYTIVNQSTALKFPDISPLTDNYHHAPSTRGEPTVSLFSCFPRKRLKTGADRTMLDLAVLERHPFTTQTFTPLNLSESDEETCYLVVVAPSLHGQTAPASTASSQRTRDGVKVEITDPPDLSNLRAFVARGGQAVTYGPGTWHAPMIVLGRRRVDFVVTQFASGVAEEDCQEVRVEGCEVDVGGVIAPGVSGRTTAKL